MQQMVFTYSLKSAGSIDVYKRQVEIKDDIFYLNDKPYEKHMVEAVHMEPMGEVTLGKDEIFVLSDDRSSSMDSRNEAIGIIAASYTHLDVYKRQPYDRR